MVDTQKVGAFIAQCRKEHNWTQKELGEKLGVTDKAVSKWEDHSLTSLFLNLYAKHLTSLSANSCPERK